MDGSQYDPAKARRVPVDFRPSCAKVVSFVRPA